MSVYWDGTVGKLIVYSRAYLECAPLYTCCHSISQHQGPCCVCWAELPQTARSASMFVLLAEKNKFTYLCVFSTHCFLWSNDFT